MVHKYFSFHGVLFFLAMGTLLLGCDNKPPETSILTLKEEFTLDFPDPSGLSFSSSASQLLIVSDSEQKFYRVSKTGQIIGSQSVSATDPEAITFDPGSGEIWVVDELSGEVIKLNSSGIEIDRLPINLSNPLGNNRLEGISINFSQNQFFIVNEKEPAVLAVLDFDGNVLNEYNLFWADDYSGLFYDEKENVLWMLSDNSKLLAKCDLTGQPIETYDLPLEKTEGVAVDSDQNLVYLVNDETGKLYIYELGN